MRRALNSSFERAYHEIHGERPAEPDVAWRAQPGVLKNKGLTFRERWSMMRPIERFGFVVFGGVVALLGAFFGTVLALVLGVISLVFG